MKWKKRTKMKDISLPSGSSDQQIKPYKKDLDYSYTLGAFPTYELIKSKPRQVRKILLDTSFTDQDNLKKLCAEYHIPYEYKIN
jgi:TrmH family RNA methyltransferase